MKIAFWSNFPGQAGTTSNMLSVALMTALRYRLKTLMLQGIYDIHQIDRAFEGKCRNDFIKEERNYYPSKGMDYLIRKSRQNEINQSVIKQSAEQVMETAYYIPASVKGSREIFERNMHQVVDASFEGMEEFADVVFIDAGNGSGEIAKKVLEKADLIVVNFNQNSFFMDQFFQERQEFIEKSIFLLSCYDSDSNYNVRNVQRIYRIEKDDLGVIPYNVGFQDAFCEGKVVKFLKGNYNCRKFDKNYYFIKEVQAASLMILRRAGIIEH